MKYLSPYYLRQEKKILKNSHFFLEKFGGSKKKS